MVVRGVEVSRGTGRESCLENAIDVHDGQKRLYYGYRPPRTGIAGGSVADRVEVRQRGSRVLNDE